MSIENQIERLTAAIEANTGALIAVLNNGGTIKLSAESITGTHAKLVSAVGVGKTALIDTTTVEGASTQPTTEKSNRGRRPTRYWKLADGSAVKSSAEDAPSAGAVEVTKDEYERLNHERSTAAHVEQTKPQASEDPFSDAPPAKTVTMEEVRAAAFAYRDKHGADKAKEVIKRVAKVERLQDVVEANWQPLIDAFEGREESDL